MPAIIKCKGVNCDKRDRCYRYTAPSCHWQSWIQPGSKDCIHFWDIKPSDTEQSSFSLRGNDEM